MKISELMVLGSVSFLFAAGTPGIPEPLLDDGTGWNRHLAPCALIKTIGVRTDLKARFISKVNGNDSSYALTSFTREDLRLRGKVIEQKGDLLAKDVTYLLDSAGRCISTATRDITYRSADLLKSVDRIGSRTSSVRQ